MPKPSETATMPSLVMQHPPSDHAQPPGSSSPDLAFVDVPRLALDQLLEQLRDRAGDVLATQGRLRGLLRANAVLASDLSLPSLLESLVEEARDLLQARYAAIVVMGANDRMDALVQVGMPAALLAKVQGHPSWRQISDLLAPDAAEAGEEQPKSSYGSASPAEPAATGFLELPVRVGTKMYGRLYLRKGVGAAFTYEDEQIVTALAATAASALANASLFNESEQRQRWLVAASGLADELLSREPVRPLETVCQYGMRAAHADFAMVTLPDHTYAAGVAASAAVLGHETLSHFVELRRDAQLTLHTGKPMLVNDYGDDDAPTEADVRVGSVVVVPLAAGEHTEGALTVGRVAGSTEFTDADLAMTAAFATQATVTLALNAARRTELRKRLEDRDRIAMDLHDHVIQELFAVGMGMEGLSTLIENPEQSARVVGYVRSLNNTISAIRMRIHQLQPNRHEPGQLQMQILELCAGQTEQLGFAPQLHFAGSPEVAVDEALADDVLAVTREALSNCARHAHASTARVSFTTTDGLLTLTITDNGLGIGAATPLSGLSHLRRRAERHSGTLTVTSPKKGGTRLTWTAHL